MNPHNYHIKENSALAKIAAKKLKSKRMAMVLGKTIHLHQVSAVDFLTDKAWLQHELCHVKQFSQHGFFRFLFLYLWQSLRNGYVNNKFEVEARAAEKEL